MKYPGYNYIPSVEILEKQYNNLLSIIKTFIPSRSEKLVALYEKYGNRVVTAPASSYAFYHNAYIGGYIDHVLRVTKYAMSVYDFYVSNKLDVSGFSKENLIFSAINHDLGKLGIPEEGKHKYERMEDPDDMWWVKNRGKYFKINEELPFMLVQDASIFILQSEGIPIQQEEFIAIKTHDGMYDETNYPYLKSSIESSRLKTNLSHIVHTADYLASNFEYKRWKNDMKELDQTPLKFSELSESSNIIENITKIV